MKITLLISCLSGGGAERQVCNLANFLAERGHLVTLLTVSGKHTYEISEKVRHVCMYNEIGSRLPKPIINLLRLYRFHKYIRKERPDVYLTFLPRLTYLFSKQRKFVKCPIIVCERNDPEKYCKESGISKEVFVKSHSIGQGYVFQTEQAKDYYMKNGIDVKNSIVIPNAISPEFIRLRYKGERDKIVVAVGRLTPQKNHKLLIKAFSKLGIKFNDYKLYIYGEGPLRGELNKLITELGMDDRIEIKGFSSNIANDIERASLYVMSSDFEGMPNTLMEAMALGLPCISTDCPVGGPKFLIRSEENGMLVPVNDECEMRKAIDYLLSNDQNRENLGREAAKIANELCPQKVYAKWEHFIEKVVMKYFR